MRILVTGASGQLASEIIRQSGALGHDVASYEKKDLDISDFEQATKVLSEIMPQIVLNCAAFNDVDGAETRWYEALSVNGIGPRNLAHACNRAGSVLVHFSTDYVFSGDRRESYSIADNPAPINRYGLSKLFGEISVKDHSERFYLIRTSWVFGGGKASFPGKLLQWSSEKDTIRMVDDQVSSPTYAVDLAGAALRLIETGNYGLYHITNSGSASRYEWAEHILASAGWKGRLEPAKSAEFGSPAARPEYSALDNYPLEKTIGYVLPHWRDAVDRFMKETR